jgi:predicted nucleic acid-binding protein
MFLLDTCTLSEHSRPRPNSGVAEWFDNQDADNLFVSVLSIGEIASGIALLPVGRKKAGLVDWLTRLRTDFTGRIVAVDEAIAETWGRLNAVARRAGRALATTDGLIAATALSRGFVLVTRNTRDFHDTGVNIIDPWLAR